MRKYKIYHTDSFTNELFGGNPTVTVLDADSLSDSDMKKIAREMNLSETGFVLASEKATFRLRFFTPPGNEIKFCGHATVGALCTVARKRLFGCTQPKNHLTIETNAGILNVEIDLSNSLAHRFIFDAPKIELIPSPYTIDQITAALGISMDLIDPSKPVMLEKTNNYLYFTARNLDCLGRIRPNMQQAIDFAEKDKIVVFCILTNETFDSQNHLHVRGFAPLVGVPEDPFTGSMQGGLAAYAFTQKMIEPMQWIGVEQGHFIERPGSVKLEVTQMTPIQVRLHSEAVTVFASELTLP
jgi:trans-2,3-dihydro-3-hydroxyanthranilate isomerase